MALLPCIKNPVRLEVYLNSEDGAGGSLYLDDGETFEFKNSEDSYAEISISYSGNMLTSQNTAGNNYATGEDQVVTQVVIYGFKSSPAAVLSGAIEVPFTYIKSTMALLIDTHDRRVDLDNVGIEVVWN